MNEPSYKKVSVSAQNVNAKGHQSGYRSRNSTWTSFEFQSDTMARVPETAASWTVALETVDPVHELADGKLKLQHCPQLAKNYKSV